MVVIACVKLCKTVKSHSICKTFIFIRAVCWNNLVFCLWLHWNGCRNHSPRLCFPSGVWFALSAAILTYSCRELWCLHLPCAPSSNGSWKVHVLGNCFHCSFIVLLLKHKMDFSRSSAWAAWCGEGRKLSPVHSCWDGSCGAVTHFTSKVLPTAEAIACCSEI